MEIPAENRRSDWPSILQLIFSGFVALFCLGGAAVLGLLALAGALTRVSLAAGSLPALGMAFALGLFGLLMLPSAALAILRLVGKPLPAWAGRAPDWRITTVVFLVLWPAALLAGQWSGAQTGIANLLFPPLTLLAAGLPILWVISIGMRGLSAGSGQRNWGLVSVGVAVVPLLALIAEALVFVAITALVVAFLLSRPELANQITQLGQRLANSGMNPEAAARILGPYLRQPGVIYAVAAIGAGVIPLLEEVFKSLPIWLLAGKGLTPGQGFAAGMLCGASFALVESLGSLIQPLGGNWAILALGRGGTALLHITTAGIMGWALAATWRDGRFGRLVFGYLAAAGLHGLWNLASLSLGSSPLLNFSTRALPSSLNLGILASTALPALVVILLAVLINANRRLRGQSLQEAASVRESNSEISAQESAEKANDVRGSE